MGFLAGYMYIVTTFNFRDNAPFVILVFGIVFLLALILGQRVLALVFLLCGFAGIWVSFAWAFKDHDVVDIDQLRTLIGNGPTDQEWIQKADEKGIYLPREAIRVRFDDQSGWHGAFRYDFELEPVSVLRLRDQKKLKKQIAVDKFHCQPKFGNLSATHSDTKRYDISSFRVGNWQGLRSGIILEVSEDGTARGCAYAIGTN
jgi:hypothetical protein